MTQIIAHRGSSVNRPENTLASFDEALRVGADGIELDVQQTKDGHLVVIHDVTVDRTTDGSGYIKDLTLAQLKELDAGTWFDKSFMGERIPSLSEVFELLEDRHFRGILNIELKMKKFAYRGMEKKVLALVKKKSWPFKIMYSSFSLCSLYRMHRLDKKAEIAYLVKEMKLLILLGRLLPWIKTLHLSHKWYFKNKYASKKGLRLWTVNNEKLMSEIFKRDLPAIITDKPEIAKGVRDRVV